MPIDKIKHLGTGIHTARKGGKLTQQELTDQSGVSVKTIRNIETGKINPSYETLYPIINHLGLSGSDLFHTEPDDQEEEVQ
jgi:transcriptional regulator with XRE-family HTH domain